MATEVNALELTRKLLSFNTINPPGQEQPCARYLGELLADGGFKVAYYDFDESRTSLIARLEGNRDKPPICFSGHLDTVPLGAEGWRKDPFSGEVDGHRVYGRGASYLGEDVKIKSIVDMGSVTTDPENEWIQAVFGIMKSYLGKRPEPRGVAYFTDASILTPAFDWPATVIMGPGEPEMAHKTDEFCRVSKIEEATEAYFEIARSWCQG